LNPEVPVEDQEITRPRIFVTMIMILLKLV